MAGEDRNCSSLEKAFPRSQTSQSVGVVQRERSNYRYTQHCPITQTPHLIRYLSVTIICGY